MFSCDLKVEILYMSDPMFYKLPDTPTKIEARQTFPADQNEIVDREAK